MISHAWWDMLNVNYQLIINTMVCIELCVFVYNHDAACCSLHCTPRDRKNWPWRKNVTHLEEGVRIQLRRYCKMGGHVSRNDFEWSYTDQPHVSRRAQMLSEYHYSPGCFPTARLASVKTLCLTASLGRSQGRTVDIFSGGGYNVDLALHINYL